MFCFFLQEYGHSEDRGGGGGHELLRCDGRSDGGRPGPLQSRLCAALLIDCRPVLSVYLYTVPKDGLSWPEDGRRAQAEEPGPIPKGSQEGNRLQKPTNRGLFFIHHRNFAT